MDRLNEILNMKIKEHTINFFKKHNLEFNSDFIDFVTLFKIDFKKNKPKIINYNTSSFSDFEKQFSKDLKIGRAHV